MMPSNYLLRRLVIPASAVGAVSLLGSVILLRIDWCPWLQDLGMNIAVTAFGALATIMYVDRVMESHEARRWAGVTDFARQRTRRAAIKTILAIRLALGIPAPRFRVEELNPDDAGSIFRRGLQEQIETARRISRIDLGKLGEMSQSTWQGFANNLADARQEAERIIELFGSRLSPSELERLLRLHRQLNGLHHCWEMFDKPFIVPTVTPLPSAEKSYPSVPNEAVLEAAIQIADDLLKTVLAILESPEYSSGLSE